MTLEPFTEFAQRLEEWNPKTHATPLGSDVLYELAHEILVALRATLEASETTPPPAAMNLKALIAATNAVLDDLQPKKHEIEQAAVNWADLSCRRAAFGIDEFGNPVTIVFIEEAAPANYHFQKAVMDGLASRGWHNVEVVTEW